MKKELKARFKEMYPNKRLLAIQLNGFTHSLFFDDGYADSSVTCETFSHYMATDEKLKYLFKDIPHYCYKHEPQEIIYILPSDR